MEGGCSEVYKSLISLSFKDEFPVGGAPNTCSQDLWCCLSLMIDDWWLIHIPIWEMHLVCSVDLFIYLCKYLLVFNLTNSSFKVETNTFIFCVIFYFLASCLSIQDCGLNIRAFWYALDIVWTLMKDLRLTGYIDNVVWWPLDMQLSVDSLVSFMIMTTLKWYS